jgi:hypothetical protein
MWAARVIGDVEVMKALFNKCHAEDGTTFTRLRDEHHS